MWKREMPAIAEISSSVSGVARWLSMYQSAFCAAFMDQGFPRSAIIMHAVLRPRLTVLALGAPELQRGPASAPRKNGSKQVLPTKLQSCILNAYSVRRLR